MKNIFLIILLFFSLFSLYSSQTESDYVKMFQFDYINLKSSIGKRLTPIFESIDYYLSLLVKKYEVKDYNYFYKFHFYMTKKKICKKIKNLKFDESLLIQKDISFLIIPRLELKKKLKQNYEIQTSLCNGDFAIPRVVVITIKYQEENYLEKLLDDELNKKFLFNEFMKIIVGKTILNYYNLKRNKLISPFPQNYLYYLSYEKFSNLVDISNNEQYKDNFTNIGNSYWIDMPYFNDYLSEKKSFLDSSFTEMTLNILEEYQYDVSKCDLIYKYIYNNRKKCVRVDQKCIDVCDLEKMFMEYYIDDKNKKIICNLNDKKFLLNKQCSKLYGNVFFDEYFEPKKMKEFLSSRKSQNLLMLKPSDKCKNNLRTVFFEYSDFYKDDPYYYIKNNINVEYTEINDPNYFVIAKLDKINNYLTKFKNLIFNNIFVRNIKNWNYNLYWDYPYPNIETINNKYQLIGKFPDEQINIYNINMHYNKLKELFPKDFNYIPETYFIPEQIDLIQKKFDKYEFTSNNAWIIKQKEKEEKNDINDNINSKSIGDEKKEYPKIIKSFNKEIQKEKSKGNFVINKYISDPLLINNKKFTLRAFVLVTGFSPLKIYFYRDGYLIFSQNEYYLNDTNLADSCVHISSEKNELKCIKKNKNKKNSTKTYEKSLFEENCTIWNFLNFERYCKKNDIDYQHIMEQAKDIIIKTFISLNDEIISKYKTSNDRNMFQLFTFDFIIENNLQLYLIDLDKNPKFNSKHLVPIYIYDHIFSDILNIVGAVPYHHEIENKTYDVINDNIYKNELEENVGEAVCEFGRPRGMFELVFPKKSNINIYKKYFGNKSNEENEILWENIEKNNDYI